MGGVTEALSMGAVAGTLSIGGVLVVAMAETGRTPLVPIGLPLAGLLLTGVVGIETDSRGAAKE